MEVFPRGNRHFLVVYPFEGRLAHQTLGMLLTRRLDRLGARPLGFVANDYALAIWGMVDMAEMERAGRLDLAELFAEVCWRRSRRLARQSSLMKRTFRLCAVISGLIERRHPGKVESGRQVTISSDLIYDVLRSTIPATSCWRRPGRMPRPASSTSAGSATSWPASRAASATRRSPT